ncbi:Crp/Fnr family transcriptional regulator [Sphingosinicella soli]|uniref:CRP/FNR family transcriptional regulator n=1 Tax=Sphingosinicella soli TaxID=333708 RepID=A0A7W7F5V2_9SPHN|nr:CRP/FNR family transcriptional regulator [Sphingosinicella soli]
MRDRSLCGALDKTALAEMARIGRRRTLAAGESLQFEGDDNILCANVLDGVLKLSSLTASGGAQTVGLLYPADFIGRPYADTVDHDITALTRAEVCIFPRAPFERMLAQNAALERQLLRRTLSELERSRRWLLFVGRKSAGARLAGLLIDIARRMAQTGCGTDFGIGQLIQLPLTRTEMADVAGLTIETVSRELGKLKDAGAIATEGRRGLRILKPTALQAIMDSE